MWGTVWGSVWGCGGGYGDVVDGLGMCVGVWGCEGRLGRMGEGEVVIIPAMRSGKTSVIIIIDNSHNTNSK